ncbi:MAG: flagellar motor protein MotB [Candidatus Puniceispirillaceae bacterium]|tara:strand:+ start:906 stop:2039 length:1134 start_codon:yes stop_codon:yes gene_type:complete
MAEDAAQEIEEEQEECPKCPPVGAPAWMATFADMATLLMAFFVLILSFAEFNVPKFKQISGSLRNAFGVQKVVPIVEQPKGTTVLSLNFSPSPSKSVTNEMTQQTTQVNQPDLEVQNKTKDGEGDSKDNADDVVKALEEAIARGDIEVQTLGEKVIVNFTPTEAEEQDLPQLLQKTLNAVERAKSAAGKSDQDVMFGGLEGTLAQLAKATAELTEQAQEQAENLQKSKDDATKAADELKIALKQQIDQGLVAVEQDEDKVIVTVGAGGAFASGSADLTPEAISIMQQIAGVNAENDSEITVSGHTDNVPLIFGSRYRDNWDLAAARSASVVQSLSADAVITDDRLEAISYGESRPVDSNETAAGRSKNRRIEIEINY